MGNRKDSYIVIFLLCLGMVTAISPAYPHAGDVVRSIGIPTRSPTGLAFDGQNIWYADREVDRLIALDPASGREVSSFVSPGYWPTGLASDGNNLWCADRESGRVYRINLSTGDVDREFESPGRRPVGLAWDGENLWISDDSSDLIYQVSPIDGTTIKSFAAPSKNPQGLCWDGSYLWLSDRKTDEIYMIHPETGWVILILDTPGEYTWGLAWAGGTLFSIDMASDSIFELVAIDSQFKKTEDPRQAKVRVVHQVRVDGPDPLKSLDVFFSIPENRANQTITGEVLFSTESLERIEDSWGQRVAHFRYENLPPATVVNTSMEVTAEISRLRYFIHPDSVGKMGRLSSDLKKYLVDGEKYRTNDPVIVDAVREAVGDEKHPYWRARKIFEYVMDHMFYELSGGWNVAPAVLTRGNGSCSEYTFVMISMLRAAGIPARYVGSVVVRGDDVSFDDVYHRWVEFYLPGYGWIPADASRGDKGTTRARAGSFGSVENSLLITTQSGGGSEYLGWTYNVDENWSFSGRCEVTVETIADWESKVEKP